MTQTIDDAVLAATDALSTELETVSLDLHARPETAFNEVFAAKLLTEWLEREAFTVERGVADLPTAFIARHEGARPGPTVAVLMEYDALPGLGHGCGHNLIGAGGAAAAIAAVRARPGHAGTLLAIGTPAEEGGGGKVHLLEAGAFDSVNAALMFHPADRGLMARHGLASAHLKFTFHGRSSHAAKNPEQGRSALAAVQLFFMAVDMLRQFVPSTARMHGVITKGGDVPNVVPALTEATMRVRDATTEAAAALVERVGDAARGAALATGCRVEITETAPMYEDRLNNMTMATRVADYLAPLGVHLEPPSPGNPAGSSDIGNVSKRFPVIHPYLQIAERDTPGHSEQMRAAAASPEAHHKVRHMASALAQTALDLLDDPAFYAEAHREFTEAVVTDAPPRTLGSR